MNTHGDACAFRGEVSGYKLIAVGSLVVAVVTACRFTRYDNESKTWEQAKQTCTCKGMQLATIWDAEFNSSLCITKSAVMVGGRSTLEFWIGAQVNKTHNNGSVQVDWIDGTGDLCSVTKPQGVQDICLHGQPGQCVYLSITKYENVMQLEQSACNASRGFICECLPAAGE